MRVPFELARLGGMPTRLVARRRSRRERIPWGSLDLARYPSELCAQARRSWTQGAISEYATAVALGRLAGALLEARAPIDLSAVVADFIVDEMVHVEDNARMAMELGGAAPIEVDPQSLGASSTADDPRERAAELALRVGCIGEAFSLPMLRAMARASRHPLPRALLSAIAREEAPHAQAGALIVAWALDGLDEAARARLATAALDEIIRLRAYWEGLAPADPSTGLTRAGFPVALVLELGWLEAGAYAQLAKKTVKTRVIEPILALGLPLDRRAAIASITSITS